MTKKRINLLFLLMLCNVASVRAEFGSFFTGLFGLFGLVKSMRTIFFFNDYNPVKRNVPENFPEVRVDAPKTLAEWFAWKYGWHTRRHTKEFEKKRDQRVTELFVGLNKDIDKRHANQMNIVNDIKEETQKHETTLILFNENFEKKRENLSQEVKILKDKASATYKDFEEKDNRRGEQNKTILDDLKKKAQEITQRGKELEEETNGLKNECTNLQGSEKKFTEKLNKANTKNKEAINNLQNKLIEVSNRIDVLDHRMQNDNQARCSLRIKLLQIEQENVRDTELRKCALDKILSFYLKEEEARAKIVNLTFGQKTDYLPFLECSQNVPSISKVPSISYVKMDKNDI